MKILVSLGHPGPSTSFNHAMASAACEAARDNGHQVIFHDLYAEGFDPILLRAEIPERAAVPEDIRQRAEELQSADGIVIVHPNWWGQPPAILKGWIDRVVRPGIAYRFADTDAAEGVPTGLLRARAVLVLNTSDTPFEREKAIFGDPLETIWKNCVFGLCGAPFFDRRTFCVMVTSTPAQRRAWLDEVKRTMNRLFPKDL